MLHLQLGFRIAGTVPARLHINKLDNNIVAGVLQPCFLRLKNLYYEKDLLIFFFSLCWVRWGKINICSAYVWFIRLLWIVMESLLHLYSVRRRLGCSESKTARRRLTWRGEYEPTSTKCGASPLDGPGKRPRRTRHSLMACPGPAGSAVRAVVESWSALRTPRTRGDACDGDSYGRRAVGWERWRNAAWAAATGRGRRLLDLPSLAEERRLGGCREWRWCRAATPA